MSELSGGLSLKSQLGYYRKYKCDICKKKIEAQAKREAYKDALETMYQKVDPDDYAYYLMDKIKELKSQGATIFVSSHILKEIQPKKEIMNLFEEIIMDVWKTKNKESFKEVQKLEKELNELKIKKK